MGLVCLVLSMCIARTTPQLTSQKWGELDCHLNDLIGPLHHRLSCRETPSNVAADELAGIISFFLKSVPEFQEVEKQFFERKESTSLEEARILKKELKKKAKKKDATPEDKSNWLKAIKLHAFLLRKKHEKEGASEIRSQEKAYKRNFFKFCKEACEGTLGKEKVQPSFTKEEADRYFPAKYSNKVDIDTSKLNWFVPVDPPTTPYRQDIIRPSDVKRILKAKSPNIAPGEDGILFGVLAKLPCIQHILATLYNKTDESSLAPASWASSLVVLAHKDGDTADPAMFRMIALTSTLGKPYHQIKAERMAQFMTKNGYIDEATQKAFLRGVNGCIEHTQVIQEVIQDAKQKKRMVHFSWYDLTDAYGSIPHNLIEHCLKHYNIPESEIKYIMNLYSQLEGRIVTKGWKSESFRFCRGIFTGDNYSPIIFNLVFQPLIDFIKLEKDKQGYALGNSRVITKPFADDFEIISNNTKRHQELQDKVQLNATTMGLTFKPKKCRTLSMVRGKPALVSFSLTDPISGQKVELKTLESDPHKFLGCVMTLNNSPEDHLKVLKEKLTTKLENIDKTKVRAEYKVAVYTRYALPSLRYHLTVHSLHKCHLEELDLLAKRFLKKWLGLPARGATSEGIFSPLLLGIKPVSQTYLEGHVSAYINSMLVADNDTKEALKSAVERESQWTRKSSTLVQCKQIMEEMNEEDDCTIPTPENCATFPVTVRIEKPKIMRVAKSKVAKIFASKSAEAAAASPFQGEMLRLLEEEGQDISWKATIHRVPRGVMAFAVRAGTNSLATPDNLARWGKQVNKICTMEGCNSICTLGHLLSSCPKSLDRFSFRHDSVLSHLVNTIVKRRKEGVSVFADLNGWRVNGGTVPPDMALTEQKPDLVVIDKSQSPAKVILVELTVPWDSANNFKAALDRKTARYERLTEDLIGAGFDARNLPIEIGCRGVINMRNAASLEYLCNLVGIKGIKTLKGALGRIALIGSYRIWLARSSQEWTGGELIRVT